MEDPGRLSMHNREEAMADREAIIHVTGRYGHSVDEFDEGLRR
jgi:hypothetical protein